jgi:hypothetical protein
MSLYARREPTANPKAHPNGVQFVSVESPCDGLEARGSPKWGLFFAKNASISVNTTGKATVSGDFRPHFGVYRGARVVLRVHNSARGERPSATEKIMNELATFFQEPSETLGVFYPKHYVIATFPSFEMAGKASHALRSEGFYQSLAVPGTDALEFFEDLRAQHGLWGEVMTEFSRFIDTEATLMDKDIQRARRGAGFVAVHSQNELETKRVRDIIEPFEPISVHWYLPTGIQSMV